MSTYFKGFIIIFMSLFILTSCTVDEIVEPEETLEIISISDLENIDIFRNGALEHILEGELNGRGQAVGFHYDGLESKKGTVIEGTETSPNEFGVYEAKVEVSGVGKTSNGGRSTFFPLEWSAQQVVDAINDAYEVKQFKNGNTYEGLTSEGQVIRMYLDQNELIISAFPVY